MGFLKRLLILAAVCVPGLVHADAGDGRKYVISGIPDAGSASQACEAYLAGPGATNGWFWDTPSAEGAEDLGGFQCKVNFYYNDGEGHRGAFFFNGNMVAGDVYECSGTDFDAGGPCAPPTPAACDTGAPGVGETFTAANVEGPNSYCNAVSQCRMNVVARTGGTMTVKHTSTDCDDAEPDPESPSEGDPETCEAIGDGEYCASNTGEGDCGYVNDTYTCLKNIKPNECKVLGDGGRVCGVQAKSTPPAPDSGTPGVPATPDGEITQQRNNSGQSFNTTYNYFNATTVAASSRDPGSDGGVDSGGSPGGDAAAEEAEEGDGCAESSCDQGVPELEDIGTMNEAFAGFWEDLQGVPIIEAAGDIAPSFATGACPVWSDNVDLYGQDVEVEFSIVCDIWGDVSPALTVVALVLWGFVAFRVLMSA